MKFPCIKCKRVLSVESDDQTEIQCFACNKVIKLPLELNEIEETEDALEKQSVEKKKANALYRIGKPFLFISIAVIIGRYAVFFKIYKDLKVTPLEIYISSSLVFTAFLVFILGYFIERHRFHNPD